jgi:hypothetical protein
LCVLVVCFPSLLTGRITRKCRWDGSITCNWTSTSLTAEPS